MWRLVILCECQTNPRSFDRDTLCGTQFRPPLSPRPVALSRVSVDAVTPLFWHQKKKKFIGTSLGDRGSSTRQGYWTPYQFEQIYNLCTLVYISY